MPNYRDAFPGKYIKAQDLGNTRPIGAIASADFEDVGVGQDKDRKLVVHFVEPSLKPLVLNRINADTIAELAETDDYERWIGCRIQLFATKTDFQGKRVPCIRICAPPDRANPPGKPMAPKRKPPAAGDDSDQLMPTSEAF